MVDFFGGNGGGDGDDKERFMFIKLCDKIWDTFVNPAFIHKLSSFEVLLLSWIIGLLFLNNRDEFTSPPWWWIRGGRIGGFDTLSVELFVLILLLSVGLKN